jgi:hypothetical protein
MIANMIPSENANPICRKLLYAVTGNAPPGAALRMNDATDARPEKLFGPVYQSAHE